MPLRAENLKIVSLDLCTDWMLLNYADPALSITYSPLLYRYKQDWLRDGLAVHDGTLEQLIEIAPDLVITGEFNAMLLVKRLLQLGIRVETIPLPHKLQDILDSMQHVSQLLDGEVVDKAMPFSRQYPLKDKKLLLLGANGIGTGRNTLENDIIEKSGWTNYIEDDGFINLKLEQLVSHPPDKIIWINPISNALANLFASHAVLADKLTSPTEMRNVWRWQCAGPWSFDLIDELSQWSEH